MTKRTQARTRKLGRTSEDRTPSVTLAPKGRRAKYEKCPIEACVSLGYAEDSGYMGTIYRHPEIELRSILPGSSLCGGIRVTMRFQSHVVNSERGRTTDVPGPSGFLAPEKGRWVYSYGGELRAPCQGKLDMKYIAFMLNLIAKARAAAPRQNTKGCDLLPLLVGLRRVGVEVMIWSSGVDAKRARRQSPDVHTAAVNAA